MASPFKRFILLLYMPFTMEKNYLLSADGFLAVIGGETWVM